MTPWSITGHYMHPVEFVLTGTVMLIGPLLVGAHVVTLYVWIVFREWEAAEGHAGYDFPWSPTHLIPFSDGATHHDFHHAKVKGNYAGFFPWTNLHQFPDAQKIFSDLCVIPRRQTPRLVAVAVFAIAEGIVARREIERPGPPHARHRQG